MSAAAVLIGLLIVTLVSLAVGAAAAAWYGAYREKVIDRNAPNPAREQTGDYDLPRGFEP